MDGGRFAKLTGATLRALTDLIFPRRCEVCGRLLADGEEVICLHCELEIPLTDIHRDSFNTIHERLASHPAIERAGAMFFYIRNDPYIRLIHHAKYNGRPHIFHYLADRYAATLKSDNFFDGIDAIQPVPMHWWKRLRRGYNQTEWLAEGISDSTGIPVSDSLTVVRHHATQTRKSSFERWLNARNTYAPINIEEIRGRHILLVDDVITTGSTIKSCAETLHTADPTIRISILSLGLTRLQ